MAGDWKLSSRVSVRNKESEWVLAFLGHQEASIITLTYRAFSCLQHTLVAI